MLENWIYKRAEISPNHPALIFEGKNWNFAELYTFTRQVGKNLYENIGTSSVLRIGILSNNSVEMYFAILACMNYGIEMVLLNTRLSFEELTVQIEDAELSYILCSEQFRDKLEKVYCITRQKFSVISLEKLYEDKNKTQCLAKEKEEFSDQQVISILYTSGTTGNPKGVMQTYGNHYASAMASIVNLGFHKDDIWVAITPLYHISGLSIIMRGLIYGMTVHLFRQFDAEKVNKAIMASKGSIVSVVSYTLKELLDNLGEEIYPDSFRLMLLGGGFVDKKILYTCKEKNIPVVQSFGMTETCSQVIALPPQDISRKTESAGRALFSNRLRIGDGTIPSGEAGEIQIKSPALCVGYLGKAAIYKQSFTEDQWFKTGDMGFIDDEGYLYVKCRMSDCIISGGENIYPIEIENCLKKLPSIDEVAVVGQADKKWGMIPCAYLVLEKGMERLKDEFIISFCKEHLASYKIPKKFIWIEQLPKTAVGKIQKYKLINENGCDSHEHA